VGSASSSASRESKRWFAPCVGKMISTPVYSVNKRGANQGKRNQEIWTLSFKGTNG